MKKLVVVFFVLLLSFSFLSASASEKAAVEVDREAPVTIDFWHTMSGTRIDLIQSIVDDFMAENPNNTVDVQYAGSYNDTLNKVISTVKLKASGIETPVTWNLHSWYFEQMICLQDALFVNNSNGRGSELPTEVVFTSAAGNKVLDWWIGIYNDGLFMDVGPGWSNHRAAFGAGEVAIGGGSLWMTNNHLSEEELAALKLVQYISSDGPRMAWYKGTGYFPV
ncbi:MAG: hypothetical protein HQ557_11635 [Bacteroidetes bacterium]|nr:hypothetical protein [Bacteroidota bacterium]